MLAKYALVAMLAVAAPMIHLTPADAAPRDGTKTEHSWKQYLDGRKSKNNSAYKVTKSSPGYKSDHDKYDHRSGKTYGWKGDKVWKFGKPSISHTCTAVAKKRFGYGKRLWGISGKAYGRNACDRAMYECRNELGRRKASGSNPFAKCVIDRRT